MKVRQLADASEGKQSVIRMEVYGLGGVRCQAACRKKYPRAAGGFSRTKYCDLKKIIILVCSNESFLVFFLSLTFRGARQQMWQARELEKLFSISSSCAGAIFC